MVKVSIGLMVVPLRLNGRNSLWPLGAVPPHALHLENSTVGSGIFTELEWIVGELSQLLMQKEEEKCLDQVSSCLSTLPLATVTLKLLKC